MGRRSPACRAVGDAYKALSYSKSEQNSILQKVRQMNDNIQAHTYRICTIFSLDMNLPGAYYMPSSPLGVYKPLLTCMYS